MRGLAQYKSTDIGTASQEQLVVRLLETAIRRQSQAVDAAATEDWPAMQMHLTRVREILGELHGALDPTAAPALAGELAKLYTWGILQCNKAVRERNASLTVPVAKVLVVLHDAWATAAAEGAF